MSSSESLFLVYRIFIIYTCLHFPHHLFVWRTSLFLFLVKLLILKKNSFPVATPFLRWKTYEFSFKVRLKWTQNFSFLIHRMRFEPFCKNWFRELNSRTLSYIFLLQRTKCHEESPNDIGRIYLVGIYDVQSRFEDEVGGNIFLFRFIRSKP